MSSLRFDPNSLHPSRKVLSPPLPVKKLGRGSLESVTLPSPLSFASANCLRHSPEHQSQPIATLAKSHFLTPRQTPKNSPHRQRPLREPPSRVGTLARYAT